MAVALATVFAAWSPAVAVTGSAYADWTLTGSGGAYSGTMALAAGFPSVTWTSTSRSPADLPTGASKWLPAGTPFGAVFGSSQGVTYLNLRPAADTLAGASTTTYVFASPIQPGGWGFALGDIDADQVEISATGTDGLPVAAADLGFQSVFNFCDASPRSSSCSGVVAPFDLPTWTPSTESGVLVGNAGATDTEGAAGWFRPTVALTSLTLVFTWRAGFPVFHTWFASLTRSVTGTVTLDATPHENVEIALVGPDGATLATTTTASDGTYRFDGYGATTGYTVIMTTPTGIDPVGAISKPTDLTATDATVDFALATPPPPTTPSTTTTIPTNVSTTTALTYEVTGTVVDASNRPVDGARVVLSQTDGDAIATTTSDAGRYTFINIEAGSYQLAVAASASFAGALIDIEVPVATGDIAPIAVAAVPSAATTTLVLAATGQPSTPWLPGAAIGSMLVGGILVMSTRRTPKHP